MLFFDHLKGLLNLLFFFPNEIISFFIWIIWTKWFFFNQTGRLLIQHLQVDRITESGNVIAASDTTAAAVAPRGHRGGLWVKEAPETDAFWTYFWKKYGKNEWKNAIFGNIFWILFNKRKHWTIFMKFPTKNGSNQKSTSICFWHFFCFTTNKERTVFWVRG